MRIRGARGGVVFPKPKRLTQASREVGNHRSVGFAVYHNEIELGSNLEPPPGPSTHPLDH